MRIEARYVIPENEFNFSQRYIMENLAHSLGEEIVNSNILDFKLDNVEDNVEISFTGHIFSPGEFSDIMNIVNNMDDGIDKQQLRFHLIRK